jgi:hypothetical protein
VTAAEANVSVETRWNGATGNTRYVALLSLLFGDGDASAPAGEAEADENLNPAANQGVFSTASVP